MNLRDTAIVTIRELNRSVEGAYIQYYEINVADYRGHLFATAERSLTTTSQAEEALYQIMKRFPEEEGFKVSIMAQVSYGLSKVAY